jgi:hypothetical protein
MKKILAIYSVALIATTLSLPILAADLGDWERFAVNVGAFVTDRVTEIRLDATDGMAGTGLDFEDDLGLDDENTVVRLDGFYRYGRRSRVDFSYFDLGRRTTENVILDIRYGDEVFSAGDTIRTNFRLDILKVAYTYSLLRSSRLDLGVTTGLHTMDIDASLTDSDGDTDKGTSYSPFPVLGLRIAYQITPKWFFKASSEWLGVESKDTEGRLVDTQIAIEHNTYRNVGFGAGFNRFDLDIESDDEDTRGIFELIYDGLQLYTKAYF